MQKSYLTLLIIYIFFTTDTVCQELHLRILSKSISDSAKIDSLGYSKIHLDVLSIEKEYALFKERTYQSGFLDAEFDKLRKTNDSTFLGLIDLKKKYDSIHIYYNHIPKEAIKKISNTYTDTFFTLPFFDLEESLNKLSLTLSDLGNPFISFQLDDIQAENNYLTAKLKIKDNQDQRYIDDIKIKGYEKFPNSFVRHYLKIRNGQNLNISEIKEKVNRLDQLSFANSIKDPEIQFTKDSTILYLYIEKQKINNFDGFIGFGTNEETNKIEFNGYLNLNLTNNLNFGERFSLTYKSDQNDQRRFQTNIEIPYLFQTPLGTEFELKLFRKDSTFTTSEQRANLFYQFNPKHSIYLGIQGVQSENLLSQEATIPLNDYKSTFYNVRYVFNLRQSNRLFPTNSLLRFQIGTGKRTLSGEDLAQNQLLVDAFKIFNLNLKNSIYVRLNSFLLDSSNILENELSWFGGINSIRGFEENSLAANLYAFINTEYRHSLSESIYIHTIIDFGYLENELSAQKENLYSFGLGFGLLTKAGLLKFNYANGKTESQNFKFSNSQVHLSLTSFF